METIREGEDLWKDLIPTGEEETLNGNRVIGYLDGIPVVDDVKVSPYSNVAISQ